jgi:hypothetical protein
MSSFTLYLPNVSLHHTIYLMMQVTYGRWSLLDQPRSYCLTSPSHPLAMGNPPCGPPCGHAPPPPPLHLPVSLEQLLATENKLMMILMENDTRRSVCHPHYPRQQDIYSSDADFLATHPPLFSEAMDPLDVDNYLCTTESKFGLLHYTEFQKTLYATQEL